MFQFLPRDVQVKVVPCVELGHDEGLGFSTPGPVGHKMNPEILKHSETRVIMSSYVITGP